MKILSLLLFLASTSTTLATDIAFGKNPKITPEFKAKVIAIAADLGTEPDYLMTVMAIETSRPLTVAAWRKPLTRKLKRRRAMLSD